MKYLKKFENNSAYEAAEGSLILPNVSLCVNENDVHYKPIPPTPSHDFVEIGGVKWAKTNVGAETETDYGNYYQYGKGAAQYAATSGDSYYSGTEDPLATSADTAAQEWGDGWRMPTQAELKSLTANTNYTFETNFNGSGVNGGKFTDKTDSSKYIFIPAAGVYIDGSLNYVGSGGNVWSSSPTGLNSAYFLHFNGGGKDVDGYGGRKSGYSVRPVVD